MIQDGNCFFRAISHQLYRDQEDHVHIRFLTIQYLIQNINDFKCFIGRDDQIVQKYINRMTTTSTCADYIAITTTALALNKNIIIHETGNTSIFIHGSDFIEHQLHVYYDVQKLNYHSIICLDDTLPFLSP
ncbi:unnamed protein product [Rotaria magnacalcarata]|nr:unnamed protein product [Rotaria magnacalcarata]CAF4121884.1 unnamed protein product [Rotaria magnacalcarata]